MNSSSCSAGLYITRMSLCRHCCSFHNGMFLVCAVFSVGITYYMYHSEISDRCQTHNKQSIPKHIHFIFINHSLNRQISDQYKENVNRCIELNPGYSVTIWNETKLEIFYKESFSMFLHTYKSYRYGPIQRNDVSRYFILYHFGGIYINMDISCQVSIDTIIRNVTGTNANADVIALKDKKDLSGQDLSAAFLASPRKHPFLIEAIIHDPNIDHNFLSKFRRVLLLIGPLYLSTVYAIYPCKEQIHLLSEELVNEHGLFLKHKFTDSPTGLSFSIITFLASICKMVWIFKWLFIAIFFIGLILRTKIKKHYS